MTEVELKLGRAQDVLRGTGRMFEAWFSDPPYGTQKGDGTGYGRRQLSENRDGRTIVNDMNLDELDEVLDVTWDMVKPNAWYAVWGSPKNRYELDKLLVMRGLTLFGEVVWNKVNPELGYEIQYYHETIILAKRGVPEMSKWPLPSLITQAMPRHEARLRHPHAKPVSVSRKVLEWITPQDGASVLDPFAGEGPIMVAAIQSGRGYLGAEMEQEWATKAITNGLRARNEPHEWRGQGAML
jgi:adenine-specific DNA-methyltransferase